MWHAPAVIPIPAEPSQVLHDCPVEAVLERDAASFHRYFAVRFRSAGAVDDLMQQMWIKAHTQGHGVSRRNAEAWLWAVARNLLRGCARDQRRHERVWADRALAADLAQRFDRERLPAEFLERQEIRTQVLLALTALPAADQELLVGKYFEGQTSLELAERFECSTRGLEGRLYRARLALRDSLTHLKD